MLAHKHIGWHGIGPMSKSRNDHNFPIRQTDDNRRNTCETNFITRGLDFSAPGSIAAGFGEVLHSYRAMQQQSSAVGLG
jgi:hypothetical protein